MHIVFTATCAIKHHKNMFTHKDIESRSIFVINCIEQRNLRVQNGELLLEQTEEKKTLTKLPFQKILALFVVGHISITTPLIEKCSKYGIPLIVMKPNLRPVFVYSITAEANYLLRKKQYEFDKSNISIAKVLITNKIQNQLSLLEKIRSKESIHIYTQQELQSILQKIPQCIQYEKLMGLEGAASKLFFSAYFQHIHWQGRYPRTKIDPINATLDIGYTILFNYIESFVRLFGFDPYMGVYHRLWFKRKSLLCDLMEPFRCIIDQQVRKAFNLKQFQTSDFTVMQGQHILKHEKNAEYTHVFYSILVEYKQDVFAFMRSYYRCFMQHHKSPQFPQFNL